MKVFVHEQAGAFSVIALEGDNRLQQVAVVERIILRDAALNVNHLGLQTDRASESGAIGDVEAMWGVVLADGVTNNTVMGLRVGSPWKNFEGSRVAYKATDRNDPVQEVERVRLEFGGAWADLSLHVEDQCA